MSSQIGTLQAGSATQASLDRTRIYTFINIDAVNAVYFGIGAAADGGTGGGKFILLPLAAVTIGPGVSILNHAAAAGTPKLCYSSEIAGASELTANGA